MAQGINSYTRQIGPRLDAPLGVLEIGEIRTGQLAHDHPGIALVAGERSQEAHRRRRQVLFGSEHRP